MRIRLAEIYIVLAALLFSGLTGIITPPASAEGAVGSVLAKAPEEKAPVSPGLSYIDNKLVFGDSNGIRADALGVDTSFYNGSIDWWQLKKIGIDFAIIRVGGRGWGSSGAMYTDSWFLNAVSGAQEAGLKTGVYFYSMAVSREEAKREARYVIDRLDGIRLELPVYIDIEFSGDYPKGRADGLTNAERVDFAAEFCDTIEKFGYQAGVYASQSFYHDELNYDALSEYSLWVANYTENSVRPASLDQFDIWQFTASARLPGVSGECDLNAVYFSEEEEEE